LAWLDPRSKIIKTEIRMLVRVKRRFRFSGDKCCGLWVKSFELWHCRGFIY